MNALIYCPNNLLMRNIIAHWLVKAGIENVVVANSDEDAAKAVARRRFRLAVIVGIREKPLPSFVEAAVKRGIACFYMTCCMRPRYINSLNAAGIKKVLDLNLSDWYLKLEHTCKEL